MQRSVIKTIQPIEKKNRSFAGKKLTIISPFDFKYPIKSADTLIYVHIPKTGGTNLVFVAEALSKTSESFKTIRFPVPRVPNRSPNLVSHDWINGFESALQELKKNPECCKDMNFISGHFPFGIHSQVNNQAKYITLIRNPLEREISSTNFDCQRGYINSDQAEQYLLDAGIDNPQTRMLAGQKFMTGECNEQTLNEAMKNIEEHFLIAGVTEETDLFIQVLSSIQNWGALAIARAQVTGDKIIENLSPKLVDVITKKHHFDLQLYDWVKNRWKIWKETFLSNLQTLNPQSNQKILSIKYDYANTRQPHFLLESEIQTYNAYISEKDIIEISQKHTEITPYEKKSMTKFLLIGLPATGKTTTFMECVNLLKKQGIDCNCISTDSFINTRMNAEDIVIRKYEADRGIKISPDIFSASNPSGAFITTYGEEPAFRDLEERFLIDIMESSHKNDWFDFGGKALMRAGTVKATEAKKIVPIFLYAEHESIIERLERNDGWRKRPTYVNASEKSSDGKGWQTLAETHRKDRIAKHIEGAAIIISVEKTSADLLKSGKEEKQDATQFKSPEEIVREIFARVKELELVSLSSRSQFSNNCMKFFENKPDEKSASKQRFQETKEWLKNNLTLRGMKPK